jgi:Putative addiction module component
MKLEQIEAELLALPRAEQADLLGRLLEYLGQTDEADQDVAADWIKEAEARDRAMDEGQLAGIPSDEVFQRIRSSFQ